MSVIRLSHTEKDTEEQKQGKTRGKRRAAGGRGGKNITMTSRRAHKIKKERSEELLFQRKLRIKQQQYLMEPNKHQRT
jgi:hypothetical protein